MADSFSATVPEPSAWMYVGFGKSRVYQTRSADLTQLGWQEIPLYAHLPDLERERLLDQAGYERGLRDGCRPQNAKWALGHSVKKKSGPSWRGTVCGYYSAPNIPIGYCVESAFESGSVANFAESALEDWLPKSFP